MLILPLLTMVIIGNGCTATDNNQTNTTTQDTPAQTAEVNFLYLNIQAVIPDTGLTFSLLLKDNNGLPIISEGNVNAKLWFQSSLIDKDFLIQEWDEIHLKTEDYTQLSGAIVVLPYDKVQSFPSDSYGILEAILTLPNGSIFFKDLWKVPIATEYRCCA